MFKILATVLSLFGGGELDHLWYQRQSFDTVEACRAFLNEPGRADSLGDGIQEYAEATDQPYKDVNYVINFTCVDPSTL